MSKQKNETKNKFGKITAMFRSFVVRLLMQNGAKLFIIIADAVAVVAVVHTKISTLAGDDVCTVPQLD